jgi:hypothetical protein
VPTLGRRKNRKSDQNDHKPGIKRNPRPVS